MKPDKQKEYNALMRLLDEPNKEMYASIRKSIIKEGKNIKDHLKEHALLCLDDIVLNRITDILSVINYNFISNELKLWVEMNGTNLFLGTSIIAQYRYPDIDMDKTKKILKDIEQDVWLEINESLSLLEKIRVLNHVLFDVYKFRPNIKDFYNPSNSYISDVIKNRTGNPVLLSIVYMIIAQNIGLPIYGINLPEHFICVMLNEGESKMDIIPQGEPLFYINPFNFGAAFSKNKINDFLMNNNIEYIDEHTSVCNNIDIVKRILNNLSYSYKEFKDEERFNDIEKLKNILNL